ncbi:hypothetical protein D3H55_16895 [Bacillus salacetis]|uniref:Uncharacterized protein n=1 Tax=Bacillus salacetis TaxID=2315464 RepID=A0A3A1QYA1_9BACI|nr:hypothetical protein D3H55_16895 [Bacillus salacetis]
MQTLSLSISYQISWYTPKKPWYIRKIRAASLFNEKPCKQEENPAPEIFPKAIITAKNSLRKKANPGADWPC